MRGEGAKQLACCARAIEEATYVQLVPCRQHPQLRDSVLAHAHNVDVLEEGVFWEGMRAGTMKTDDHAPRIASRKWVTSYTQFMAPVE